MPLLFIVFGVAHTILGADRVKRLTSCANIYNCVCCKISLITGRLIYDMKVSEAQNRFLLPSSDFYETSELCKSLFCSLNCL